MKMVGAAVGGGSGGGDGVFLGLIFLVISGRGRAVLFISGLPGKGLTCFLFNSKRVRNCCALVLRFDVVVVIGVGGGGNGAMVLVGIESGGEAPLVIGTF